MNYVPSLLVHNCVYHSRYSRIRVFVPSEAANVHAVLFHFLASVKQGSSSPHALEWFVIVSFRIPDVDAVFHPTLQAGRTGQVTMQLIEHTFRAFRLNNRQAKI
jgi:hypothetical protein